MTLRELRKASAEWKVKLGLRDWTINVIRPSKSNPMAAEFAGHAYWKPEYQEATIILQPGQGLHSLVHELIHVRLESHGPAPREYDPLYERGINALTEALIGKPEPAGLTLPT